jgi:DNA-binding GntR family transcriptional regulator
MRLSEKAYHQIKERIITLELAPSSLIDEQTLMNELNLGRTPIREAIQRLDSEGLVNVVPRRGTFVADVSITDLQKIFELRIFIEGLGARLAAQRITRRQIARMERTLQNLKEQEDAESLMEVDRQFHELLYQATDNEFLVDVLSRFYDLSLRLWYLVLERLGDVQDSVEQHREIIEALKSRDADRAEALIQRHIREFQREIKAVL